MALLAVDVLLFFDVKGTESQSRKCLVAERIRMLEQGHWGVLWAHAESQHWEEGDKNKPELASCAGKVQNLMEAGEVSKAAAAAWGAGAGVAAADLERKFNTTQHVSDSRPTHPARQFTHDEEREIIAAKVISAVQEHGKWSGEVRMVRKNGTTGWIESMCVPVFDENNEIQGAIGINRDITEQKNEKERLQHLANYDQLTEIPNRFLLLDRAEHLISQSARDRHIFALLFIDVDKFKVFNDTKGHSFGDQVLKQIALRLKQSIRNSDTVARFGGDEFVVLLENIASRADASTIVEILIKQLEADFAIDDATIKVECSAGIAIYPEDGITTDALLAIADKNMYKTKYKE